MTTFQPLLAASEADATGIGAIAALVGVVLLFGLFIGLAVNAVVCWIISSALERIPAEHRKISPGQVWLLMIPCFPIIWNFVVFQRVPASFKSHFASVGRGDVGDCGAAVGLWYSIVTVACYIPLLNYIAGPAALVLLILNLVKFHDLKNRI